MSVTVGFSRHQLNDKRQILLCYETEQNFTTVVSLRFSLDRTSIIFTSSRSFFLDSRIFCFLEKQKKLACFNMLVRQRITGPYTLTLDSRSKYLCRPKKQSWEKEFSCKCSPLDSSLISICLHLVQYTTSIQHPINLWLVFSCTSSRRNGIIS